MGDFRPVLDALPTLRWGDRVPVVDEARRQRLLVLESALDRICTCRKYACGNCVGWDEDCPVHGDDD